jgi:predicted XRE-type DNA-binding protein
MKSNTPEDVWKYINKKGEDECWEWIGAIHNRYGRFSISGKIKPSHYIVYELINNSIPIGLLVCHKCDNPKCCNPKHLFLGTHGDNMRDMINKGRDKKAFGEMNGNSKIKKKEVDEIKQLYSTNNYSQRELAKQFNISQSTIFQIVNRRTWI